jgi:hypothetical protein
MPREMGGADRRGNHRRRRDDPTLEFRAGTIPRAGGSSFVAGDSWGTARADRAPVLRDRHAVNVTGMSTTLISDPSIALTSYTWIVPGCVEPTWYCTSVE